MKTDLDQVQSNSRAKHPVLKTVAAIIAGIVTWILVASILNFPLRAWWPHYHDPRTVVRDEQAHYFGTPLEKRSLVPGENALLGSCHFADWLSRTAPQR